MSLLERLQEDVKVAMKARDKPRLGTLRMTVAELKRAAIDARAPLDEAAEIEVLQRAVKKRREAAQAFEDAGRPDSARQEESEAELLAAYLPSQLDDAELAAVVRDVVAATGAASPKDMGKVIGRVLAEHRGRVDGGRVKDEVLRQLQG